MLKEINSEQTCPICGKELHITGTFKTYYLIHTCFNCKTTFVNENASTKLK